jgi:hypothetical protein
MRFFAQNGFMFKIAGQRGGLDINSNVYMEAFALWRNHRCPKAYLAEHDAFKSAKKHSRLVQRRLRLKMNQRP